MSTAIVHEWVSARAGSEQVFEALASLWPDADLYALSCAPGVELDLQGRTPRTTFLDTAALREHRGLTLPVMPLAWRSLGCSRYDLVISSHHAFATSNRLAGTAQHLAYVHAPARYLWTPAIDRRGCSRALWPVRRALMEVDRRAAARLSGLAANSRAVAERIASFWDRVARVIHPPVDIDYFAAPPDDARPLELPGQFLLGLGRFVPYKNHLRVLRTAERCGLPVVLAGGGPLAGRLREAAAAASVPAVVIEQPSRPQVRELLQRAAALVFPTEEDFGIVPVEAMAAGTPVIALGRGGATETVVHGRTGALVQEDTVEAFAGAVDMALSCRPGDCARQAILFHPDRFRAEVLAWATETGSRP